MKITYDPEVDILMIRIDENASRRTSGIDLPFGEAYADLTEEGTILAIEIQHASKKYPLEMLLKNQATYGPMPLAEASMKSGISPQALKKACERGALKGKKIGRNWTVDIDALLEYKENRVHGGPGSAAEVRVQKNRKTA